MTVLTIYHDNANLITNILVKNNINFQYSMQFSFYDFFKNEYNEFLNVYYCFKIKKKVSKKLINEIKSIDEHIILLFINNENK